MYKEEELFEKVKGHVKENDIKLLHGLVDDINELNQKYVDECFEVYIDFDNVGIDCGEYDPYETFSIRLRYNTDKVKLDRKIRIDANIHDGLDIHTLDDCLCTLCCYFEELEDAYKQLGDINS